MSYLLAEFVDLFVLYYPLFLLFLLCMVGYWFACSDFKPRPVSLEDNIDFHSQIHNDYSSKKQKLLSNRQLGINDLRNFGNAPAHVQRSLMMEKKVREYSTTKPDETTNILKRWLHE
jgi:flagellar biosynthesis/type III secretory pathway M-ring protein FliF/YscJ